MGVVYVCMGIYLYVCVCVCGYVCMCMYVCVCICMCVYVCMYIYHVFSIFFPCLIYWWWVIRAGWIHLCLLLRGAAHLRGGRMPLGGLLVGAFLWVRGTMHFLFASKSRLICYLALFRLLGGLGAMSKIENSARASSSVVYPVGKLQWHFACGSILGIV